MDILDLILHYDLFFKITGDRMEAYSMGIGITFFIYIVTFFTVRAIFYNSSKFKGKGTIMHLAFAIISSFLTDFIYQILEKFTIPLIWLYKYWLIFFIGAVFFLMLFVFVFNVIKDRKKIKTKNKIQFV